MSDKPKIHFDLPTGVQATDITQVFTSKPYPVVVIDAMTARATIESMRIPPTNSEAVDSTATIRGVTLKPQLVAAGTDPDAVDAAASLNFLELVDASVPSQETALEPEAVDSTATMTSLELNPALVSNSMEPEAVDSTATLTSLQLN